MTAPLFIAQSGSLPKPLAAFAVGDRLALPDELARHVVKSLRMGAGEELTVSDGEGGRLETVLSDAEKGLVQVRAVTREPAPAVRLCLVQALAKAGRDELAIEESTEIGVDAVLPWQADRSIVQWEGAKAVKAARKWETVLRAASEQSRRAWVPVLHERLTSNQLVRFLERAIDAGDLAVVLHQDAAEGWGVVEDRCRQLAGRIGTASRALDGQTAWRQTGGPGAERPEDKQPRDPGTGRDGDRQPGDAESKRGAGRTIYVVVGPEGGISDREIGQFHAIGALTSLIGTNILRASTAGPVALSLLSRVLGRF